MNGVTTPTLIRVDPWHELYKAALFETDKRKFPLVLPTRNRPSLLVHENCSSVALTILRKIKPWMTLCTRYEPCRIAPDGIQPPPELARANFLAVVGR
jgi:hypothetical protein